MYKYSVLSYRNQLFHQIDDKNVINICSTNTDNNLKMKNITLICILLLLTVIKSYSKFIPVSLEEKITLSELIIEGEVLSEESYFNESETMIFTDYNIKIYKIFKGQTSREIIKLVTIGGQLGDRRITICPDESMEIGQYGIFFLIPAGFAVRANDVKDKYELFSSVQGFYEFTGDEAISVLERYSNIHEFYKKIESISGIKYKEINRKKSLKIIKSYNQDRILVNITSFSPTTINAGTGDTLTIRGTGFGNVRGTVNFRNADNGGASYISAPSNSFITWTDTLIKLKVPSKAGTGTIQVIDNNGNSATSSSSLTVRFALLNVNDNYYIHLVNYNNNGGYRFTFNNNLYSNQAAVNCFMRALETWRCQTYVRFDFANSTSNITCPGSDGINILSMSTNSCPVPNGVLAYTYSYWFSCSGGNNWFLNEVDIIMNSNVNWNWGPGNPSNNQSDAESVILHEFGHAHLLGHVIGQSYSMHYAINYGTIKRQLNSWSDVAGGEYVMNYSTPSGRCGYGAMQPLNSNNCGFTFVPIADFSASPRAGCGSLTVQFNDQSENNPTQWLWDVNNDGINDYTTRNPQHTYNQVGNYSVRLIAINNSGRDTIIKSNFIQVYSIPEVEFTGLLSVCNKSTVSYNATNPTGFSHSWSVNGGVIQGSTNSSNVSVRWDNDSPGTLKLVKTNDTTGCTDSITKIITINPLPEPDFSGNFTVCAKTIETYTANTGQGVTNQWYASGGTIVGPITGDEVKVQWGTTETGNIKLIQTNNLTNCSDSISKNITINPLPKPAISGEFNVCERSIHKYSAPNLTGFNYQWIVAGGSIQGNNNVNEVEILWSNVQNASLKLIMINSETGCKDSITENITVNMLPKPEITGNNIVCQNREYVYSSNFHSLLAFMWEVDNGRIIGLNSNREVRIVWNEPGIGKLKLIQRNNSTGCKDSTEFIVNVLQNPDLSLIGDMNVCHNTIYSYKTTKQADVETYWYTNQGSLLDVNKSDSMRIKWMVKGIGILKIVRINLVTGCKDSTELKINVIEFKKSVISGDSVVCSEEIIEYFANTSNDYQYFWVVENGEILENNGNNIKVSWNYAKYGKITLIKTLGNRECTDTTVFSVQLKNKEKILFNQELNVCNNSQEIILDIAQPSGGRYVGSGIIDNKLYPKELEPGTYEFEYIYDNQNGCLSRASASFTVLEIPDRPHISLKNDTIFSDFKGKNRWFLDNIEIGITENNFYLATQSGFYSVEAIADNGCNSIRSDSIYYFHSNISSISEYYLFDIIPNPAENYIELQIKGNTHSANSDIRIYDILGRCVLNTTVLRNTLDATISRRIDISFLPSGLYYLKLDQQIKIFFKI